jgi:hypothetical protein
MKKAPLPLTILALAVALVAATVAPAVASHPPVQRLSIAVLDHDGREIAVISPEQSVMLPRDTPIQLRMFEQIGNERRVVPTEFRVQRGSEALNHTRNRQDRGEVTVELRRNANPTGPLYLEYTIPDDVPLANDRMRRGHLRVEIGDWGGMGQAEVDRLVGALYRGILLREPDQQGGLSARQSLLSGGWSGLARLAQEIASSRESEIDVYERGACNQQRLLAMYRELQGRESRTIDQRIWRAQLEQMGRGDIGGVVAALTETPEFQSRFGLRTARRR